MQIVKGSVRDSFEDNDMIAGGSFILARKKRILRETKV
jgi:hypothetical protein